MARLQTSGDISLQDLISFFGGGNKLTDFYRGGGLVPTQRLVREGYYYDKRVYGAYTDWMYARGELGANNYYHAWRDGLIWNNYMGQPLPGTYQESGPDFYIDGWHYELKTAEVVDTVWYNQVRRRPFTIEQAWEPPLYSNINTGVPSSGDIKLTDFYGAYDS